MINNFVTSQVAPVAYEDQIQELVADLAHAAGYRLPDEAEGEYTKVPVEVKTDKPWGAYLTLNKTETPEGTVVEKILIVRPTPNPVPDSWNIDGGFANFLRQETGDIHTALSFQRHFYRKGEKWEVLSGEGLHLTSEEDTSNPSFDQVHVTKISPEVGQSTVEHLGRTWHSVVNTGPDFLVLREYIYCLPGHSHDETDIERAHDLVGNRSGTNENK